MSVCVGGGVGRQNVMSCCDRRRSVMHCTTPVEAKDRVHVFGHKVISGNVNGPPPFTDVSATEVYTTVDLNVIAKARVFFILASSALLLFLFPGHCN